jgi:hypothetical protein
MHAKGIGVTANQVEAARWFARAAEQGNREAQVQLALMYQRGDGVARNTAEADKWFKLAGKHISKGDCDGAVCVSPAVLVAGEPAVIQYTPAGGPLAGAAHLYAHLGWSNWEPVVAPDLAMTYNQTSKQWKCSVNIPKSAVLLDCSFTDGGTLRDDNNRINWSFAVSSNHAP